MTGLTDMGVDELRHRLVEFDRAVELLHPGRSFVLVLVGGGAMILLGCLPRATADLDALQFPRELLPLMEQYDLNGRVQAFGEHFAYNYEDRLIPIDINTKVITCYSASLEDLVASKLHSNRDQDALDIREPLVLESLDWNRLHEVVLDMEGSRLIERRHREFLRNYESYREECKPCDS